MKKIVLIDDVAIANFIMKKLISTVLPDAQVRDFTNSQTALDSIGEIGPDLIFLDLNMPDLNGFQFLDAMRENGLHYKVIILSSSTSDIDKQQAASYGNVVGYYVKPLDKTQLSVIFQEHLA